MLNYHEIKEEESEKTKNYSDKSLNRYIKGHKFLRGLYSELFFWVISLIPFAICPLIIGPTLNTYTLYLVIHFFFWMFYGKKKMYIGEGMSQKWRLTNKATAKVFGNKKALNKALASITEFGKLEVETFGIKDVVIEGLCTKLS